MYYQIKQHDNNNILIFIHGSGETSKVWEKQFELELPINLVAIDLPSHGKTDHFNSLSLDIYSECILKLIDGLNFSEIILCGHSLGGTIAQQVYLENPKRISGLILIGTGAKLGVSPFIFESIKEDYQKYLDSIPIGAFYRKTEKETIRKYVEQVAEIPSKVTFADFSICNEFNVINEVKSDQIKVPTLVICGQADKLTPVKYSQFFEEYVKDVALRIIRKAGHMVMIEKPKKVNEAIEDFIANKMKVK